MKHNGTRSAALSPEKFWSFLQMLAMACMVFGLGCSTMADPIRGDAGSVQQPAADSGLHCTSDQRVCSGQCVNTQDDANHCGGCNNRCPSGNVCRDRRCVPAIDADAGAMMPAADVPSTPTDNGPARCANGLTTCGDSCVDLMADRMNCGECGTRCPSSQVCSRGMCGTSCQDRETNCSGACRDLQNDRMNCGTCGRQCGDRQVCAAGTCGTACANGFTNCDGNCRDLSSDRVNCGSCGNVCQSGQVCAEGRCRDLAACTVSGQTNCGTPTNPPACRDLANDSANCGACNVVCPIGHTCAAGRCSLRCPGTQSPCNGACRDFQSDNDHCGACNRACAAGSRCEAGTCVVSCASDQTNCSGTCRNLQSDNANCGMCGRACTAGQVCSNGTCQVSCGTGLTACGASCVNTQNNAANCGACGRTCLAGQICSASQCACPGTLTNCGGVCLDVRGSDNANCGRCGNACPAGTACSNGTCQVSCGAGLVNCSGTCRNLQSDNANCGMCGRACTAGQVCSNGTCQVSCGAGLVNCSGTCRNLQSDNANCGMCGRACTAGQVCSNGTCQVSCGTGLTACGAPSVCVSLESNAQNCGACGNACPGGQVCSNGACRVTCPIGQTNCGTACRDTRTDSTNCGGCGVVCPMGTTCSDGRCGGDCPPNQIRCSGVCRDIRIDTANCGACGNACPTGEMCSNGACMVPPACMNVAQVTRVVLNPSAVNAANNPNGFSFMSCSSASLVATVFAYDRTPMSGFNGTTQLGENTSCGVRVISAFCGGTLPSDGRAIPTGPVAVMHTWANPTSWRSVVGHSASEFGVSSVTGDGGVNLLSQTRMCLDTLGGSTEPGTGLYALRPVVFRFAAPLTITDAAALNAFWARQCPKTLSGNADVPCRRSDSNGQRIDSACPE